MAKKQLVNAIKSIKTEHYIQLSILILSYILREVIKSNASTDLQNMYFGNNKTSNNNNNNNNNNNTQRKTVVKNGTEYYSYPPARQTSQQSHASNQGRTGYYSGSGEYLHGGNDDPYGPVDLGDDEDFIDFE